MTEEQGSASKDPRELKRLQVAREADRIMGIPGADLVQTRDPISNFRQDTLGILFDWSQQRIDSSAMAALESLGQTCCMQEFLQSLASGERINQTENRSVEHLSLRAPDSSSSTKPASRFAALRTEFLKYADSVRDGALTGCTGELFTDFVHIGIGGSHLGPQLVCEALTGDERIRRHFCSNADRRSMQQLLRKLSPNRTLFIIASKSYTTHETLENARIVRSWMYERTDPSTDINQHFVHITSKQNLVPENERVFPIPETIGGRFSLWSAMGLPIALSLGSEKFLDLLAGANEMDRYILGSKLSQDVAARTALLAMWNTNFLGATSHLVLPYDSRLQLLPAYCQQLEMESNGKNVGIDNKPVVDNTSPVVWGSLETDGQHAWHQFLHQGTQNYSADIVATLDELPSKLDRDIHQWIVANAVGQASVMLRGNKTDSGQVHKAIVGNHGCTLMLLQKLDARTLGSLLAMYEHKVAYLGHLWGVNSFDQWGVEEGKRIAGLVNAEFQGQHTSGLDDSTVKLVRTIRAKFNTR